MNTYEQAGERVKAEHRAAWGNFGWGCSCGAGREWSLSPVNRARAAKDAHLRAQFRMAHDAILKAQAVSQ